ncbi:MAG: DUF378 domain-containing protein [Candidatus Woesebacteria bacterium]
MKMTKRMDGMSTVHIVAFVLVIVGGINWGLLGMFGYNMVHMILWMYPMLEQIVYILVGLSAFYLLATHKRDCMACARM